MAVDFPDADYFEVEYGFEEDKISGGEQVDADDDNSQQIGQQEVGDVEPEGLLVGADPATPDLDSDPRPHHKHIYN